MRKRVLIRHSFLRSIANTKGVTLVEGMLAMGIVAIIALTSATFFSGALKSSPRSRETCRLYNTAFLNRIRSYGAVGDVGNFAPAAGLQANSSSVKYIYSQTLPPEITEAVRWPTNRPILPNAAPTSTPPEINNYLLINGYMTILQDLYNQNPAICSAGISLGSTDGTGLTSTSLMIPYPEGMRDSSSDKRGMTVQIIPFDIDTGQKISCPSAIYVAPRGAFLTDTPGTGKPFGTSNVGTDTKVTRPTNVFTNVGFAVQVKSIFINDDNQKNECLTEERFQYNIDNTPPPVPTLITATKNSADENKCGIASTNQFTMDIGYDGTTGEAGSVLLCQDLSAIPITPLPTAPATQAVKLNCYDTNNSSALAKAGPQISEFPASYYPADPFAPVYDYSTATFTGLKRWVPCQTLTICNVPPDGSLTTAPVATPTGVMYKLVYKNLPSDCRIMVKVAALDTAANATEGSSSSYKTTYTPPITIASQTFIPNWDVPRPRCRAYCPNTPTSAWPDGYFTCNPSGACP